ncbi:MAG: amidohydrolase family protein [Phycisphaerales bacterium]|nr:amidohydrolase family protein [Phycisphaerales bacterium]
MCDATGLQLRPVAGSGPVAVAISHDDTLMGVGTFEELSALCGENTRILKLPDRLIMPALVNTHAHLDLTHLGPQPYTGDFIEWLSRITELRLGGQTSECIAESVTEGLRLSHEQGVGYLGDIAGSVDAVLARHEATMRLPGVSYFECFGVGHRQVDGYIALLKALNHLPDSMNGFSLGISPHAPYTAGLSLYLAVTRLALDKGYALSTHLAESPAEIDFTRDLAGPFVDRRKQLNKWDDTLAPSGLHPIDWLEPALRQKPWLIAHANITDPSHHRLLDAAQTSVAYCPRASSYFGFPPQGEHPYKAMLQAGVNVCLGTDSILCQPASDKVNQPHSILEQMRYLYQRDHTDPQLLLRMATVNGIQALGLPSNFATLKPGAPARLIQVRFNPDDPLDVLTQVLTNTEHVSPVAELT